MANLGIKEKLQYMQTFNFPLNQTSKYEKVAKIGQGTFGEVFKAREKGTNTFVAMKKVLMHNEKDGVPITTLREIRILQLVKHENVVDMIEICSSKKAETDRYDSTFYLIFEFCQHDLAGLLANHSVKFSLGEIKIVMKQLLNGLYYIHTNKVGKTTFCLVCLHWEKRIIFKLFK